MSFAQLHFEVAEPQVPEPIKHGSLDEAYSQSTATFTQPIQHAFAGNSHLQERRVNLNSSSFEHLQTLPHIGFDRALDIMTLRPITDISQRTEIKGIGPARLADIKQAGVVL